MANIYDMIDTWNNGATTFTAIKMDVLDSASAANSLLLDLKVDGVTKASINKDGGLTVGTIDGTVIGGSTAAAGTFTTGQFDTSVNVDGTVTADGLSVDGAATVNSNIFEVSSTSPSIRLTETDVTGKNTQLFNAGGKLRIRTASDDYGTATERLRIDHATGDISFYEDTGTTAKLFWDASAESLGIGTSSPSSALDVSGTVTANGGTIVSNGSNAFSSKAVGGYAIQAYQDATSTNHTALDLRSDSTLSNRYLIRGYNNAAITPLEVFSVGSDGTVTADAYNTSSDERLKENISDAPAGNVDDIKVRSFDWKVDGSHQDYGMVAQELESVAPYAVTKGETEDDMWSVDYSKLVPMMLKEIQSLRARVAQLEGAN